MFLTLRGEGVVVNLTCSTAGGGFKELIEDPELDLAAEGGADNVGVDVVFVTVGASQLSNSCSSESPSLFNQFITYTKEREVISSC